MGVGLQDSFECEGQGLAQAAFEERGWTLKPAVFLFECSLKVDLV